MIVSYYIFSFHLINSRWTILISDAINLFIQSRYWAYGMVYYANRTSASLLNEFK